MFTENRKIMKKIKIVHIVDSLGIAGLDQVVIRLANSVDKDKFEVFVCALKSFRKDAVNLLSSEVHFKCLSSNSRFITIIRLLRFLQNNKINIVHSHNWSVLPSVFIARVISLKDIHFIHCEHGMDVGFSNFSFRRKCLSIFLYPRIDKLVCVSENLKDFFCKKFNVSNLVVIENGVDESFFLPEDKLDAKKRNGFPLNHVIIGTVAVPRPVKRIDFIIDLLKELRDLNQNVFFVHVGARKDSPAVKNLSRKASELDVLDRVLFLGVRHDINKILPGFDVYINTSLFEGTSCSVLEAMSVGLPIVASNVGGNSVLVNHSVNGLLFDTFKKNDALIMVSDLIQDEKKLISMGNKSRNIIIKKYSLKKITKKYEELYHEFF
ncbi:MAG: glycosyltransferase [Desulforegulaceae bacterium]|nr:glycosyltransferase [Desulforegulaceae bacterium]